MRVMTMSLAVLLAMPAGAAGRILQVPGSFATVQSAIISAEPGDTVLVGTGRYVENINFLGKNITVASQYIVTGDPADISATILDGSSPAHLDTASCVLIVSGEGPEATLEGFTITGGTGTKWLDEHGAGLFREGGGILITLSSPVVRNNYIVMNEAVNAAGAVSAGGGGIRVGDGSPLIEGNVIMSNSGLYGGGIVLNYCSGAIIRNNIITQNKAYEAFPGKLTFGGGGVWILERKPGEARPNILENNSIVGNLAFGSPNTATAGRGGALVVTTASVTVRNTIVWNNYQDFGDQINGSPTVSYSCVQGGIAGIGNITAFPIFADTALLLADGSPCIDAGDPDLSYDDTGIGGTASFPSRGGVRNDIGAYGGPRRAMPGPFSQPGVYAGTAQVMGLDFGLWLPGEEAPAQVPVSNLGSATLRIDSVQVVRNQGAALGVLTGFPLLIAPGRVEAVELRWSPTATVLLEDTLLLYHTGSDAPTPLPVALSGSAVPTVATSLLTETVFLGNIDVNTLQRDTTVFIVNSGTAPDSVYLSVDLRGVSPPTAAVLTPVASVVPARDSIAVTFTLLPSQVMVTGLGIYSPKIIVESRFNPGTTRFERSVNFRIVGTAGIDGLPDETPSTLRLGQNYPNPFNPTTTIEFTLPAAANVDLTVYDALGREVDQILRSELGPGTFRVQWDATGRPSGEYFYRLTSGGYSQVRKLILLR